MVCIKDVLKAAQGDLAFNTLNSIWKEQRPFNGDVAVNNSAALMSSQSQNRSHSGKGLALVSISIWLVFVPDSVDSNCQDTK